MTDFQFKFTSIVVALYEHGGRIELAMLGIAYSTLGLAVICKVNFGIIQQEWTITITTLQMQCKCFRQSSYTRSPLQKCVLISQSSFIIDT